MRGYRTPTEKVRGAVNFCQLLPIDLCGYCTSCPGRLAPDVPAVLIETGFLTNAVDERRLNQPREREAMAEAMARAVDGYFAAPQLYAAGA